LSCVSPKEDDVFLWVSQNLLDGFSPFSYIKVLAESLIKNPNGRKLFVQRVVKYA